MANQVSDGLPGRPQDSGDHPHAGDAPSLDEFVARAVIDRSGTVTGWNAGAERLLGHRAADIVGRPASTLLAEEIPAGLLDGPAGQPRLHGTLALRHADGRSVPVAMLAHRRDQPGGGGDWLVVSAVDAAPPGPADDVLIRQAHDAAPSCSFSVYDTDLRMRHTNAISHSILGMVADDIIRGLRLSDVLPHMPNAPIVENLLRQSLATGETLYEEMVDRAPGEPHEHAWSAHTFRVHDPDGRVLGVASIGHDVTEPHLARARLKLVADAGKHIGTTLDVTRTAEELAEVIVPELADFIGVDLLAHLEDVDGPDPAAPDPSPTPGAGTTPVLLRRAALRSVLPGAPESALRLGQTDEYPPESPVAACMRSGRAVLHSAADPEYSTGRWLAGDTLRGGLVREHGVHAVMTVPLVARGIVLGVAVLVRHRHQQPFGADDLVLAEELAARAAVAVDNARRFTQARGAAVALQRSLLPRRLPTPTAVEVAHRYLPASAGVGVGGDWFDVIPLSGARVALVVGDVVGHGVHASATMGRLRAAVRTLADIDLSPDELLTHLDDLVSRMVEAGSMHPANDSGDIGTTCLYAVYDPISRRCSMARAGHPPPVVVDPEGSARLLRLPAGPPLGLAGLPFEAAEFELPEGSLLALYTDGLIRSREWDVDAGVARLNEVLSDAKAPLDSLCDAALADLLPQPPTDDVALLVARTRALSPYQVARWEVTAEPECVARARKNATAQLEAWGLDEEIFATELIVSELITNAIRHAEPPIELRLIRESGNLICEVSDASNTAPHMRRARIFDEGGRGLLLVAQLSRRWGTRQSTYGKTIWSEQSLPGGLAGPEPAG